MNNEITQLIERFLSKKDQSLKAADAIEYELSQNFPNDEYIEDVTDMLAQYRPGGGDYLYSEKEIEDKLLKLKLYLEK